MVDTVENAQKTPLLSDHIYNVLKPTATIVLPGLATLYFALAQIWGLPNPEQVVGTVTAVNTFLGLLLGVSTRSYNKSDVNPPPSESDFDGDLIVSEDDGEKYLTLGVNQNIETMASKDTIRLRIVQK